MTVRTDDRKISDVRVERVAEIPKGLIGREEALMVPAFDVHRFFHSPAPSLDCLKGARRRSHTLKNQACRYPCRGKYKRYHNQVHYNLGIGTRKVSTRQGGDIRIL